MQDDHVVQGPVRLVGGKAINLAQRLERMAGKVAAVFAGPLEGVDEPVGGKAKLCALKLLFHKELVERIVVVGDQDSFLRAELDELFRNHPEPWGVSYHLIADMVDRRRLRRNRASRINQAAEGPVFYRIEGGQFNDSILVVANTCRFRVVVNGT